MEIGESVAWQDEDDENVRYYGVVRDLDGDPPDAAHVMEIGAWHRAWGHSTAGRGNMFSVAVSQLEGTTSSERNIMRSEKNRRIIEGVPTT